MLCKRVQGSGFWVEGLRFRVQGSGFRGLGFRVWGFRFWVVYKRSFSFLISVHSTVAGLSFAFDVRAFFFVYVVLSVQLPTLYSYRILGFRSLGFGAFGFALLFLFFFLEPFVNPKSLLNPLMP